MALDLFLPKKSKNQRPIRVAQQIKEVIAYAFLRGEVPLQKGTTMITISHVDMSPDLKYCDIWISLVGEDAQEFLKEINALDWFFKKHLAKNMQLRFVPQVRFKQDLLEEKAKTLEQKIIEANKK